MTTNEEFLELYQESIGALMAAGKDKDNEAIKGVLKKLVAQYATATGLGHREASKKYLKLVKGRLHELEKLKREKEREVVITRQRVADIERTIKLAETPIALSGNGEIIEEKT